MSETPRRQSEFLDILARLIDPQLQLADAQNLSPEQRVEVQFKQLPWSVEHAIIEFLYGESPDLFVAEPTHLFPDCSYGDASDDLTNRDSYYDGHSYIRHYQFSDEFVRLSGSASGDGGLSTVPAALDLWMKANGLFEPSEDHRDPHFAERAFLVNVFVPAFGMPALNHLKPQKPYCPYSVDFELQTASGPVIIEVDGFEYHDRDINQFEYERKRQNELTAKGLPFYRFPARRILREPDSVVGELKSYITLSVQTELDLFSTSAEDDFADSAHLIQFALDYCRWFRPFQLSLLLALSRAMGKDSFVIAERASPSGLLFVAAYELGCLIARLQEFYGVALPWPKCVRMLTASDPNRKVINEFQKALTNGPDRQDEHPLPFTVSLETRHDTESGPRADLITDINREGRIPIVPEGGAVDVLGHESLNLATLRARLKALVISRPGPRNKLLPKDVRKQTIDYFARRLLRVPALYHHYDPKNSKTEERQYELVRRVLEKKPVLGIMPTGRGKSIAFQLPALLLPGSALVVSPLRALMRDQINDLRLGRGVNAVEAIRYDMSRPEKDRAADDFLNGYVKLLYVSPERLQEINFSKKLAEAAAVAHVSFLAIDEAHCVSEWGHDFRLSYMHIRHFQADLAERQPGVTCPIVALTAMASPTVRLDVCSILALERADVRAGGDLVNEENIDRTELSLSVHKVTGQDYAGDRESILRDVLARCVPRALRNNHEFSWERFARGEWKGRGTGAVFCIYKDAHGQTAWHDGVGAVRDYLVHEEVIGRESLKMFAADSPGFCPSCHGERNLVYTFRRLTKGDHPADGEAFECINGHRFGEPLYHDSWSSESTTTQFSFKNNSFPLLVTTKAYGMGIDHRGLRFIVHYGLSSSLESYYQEIGRAGRDGKQAHCALLVRPPHPKCDQQLKKALAGGAFEEADDKEILPPCMLRKNRTNRTCAPEIGFPEPCDFARQLMLILRSYVKPEGFAKKCAEVWAKITISNRSEDGTVTHFVSGSGMGAEQRLTANHNYLYRLKQLGLVQDFRLQYRPARSRDNKFDVVFHISLPADAPIDDVVRNLASCIRETRRIAADAEVPGLAGLLEQLRTESHAHRRGTEFVKWAIRRLYRAIRGHVIKMRLQSFENLLAYVESEKTCRRHALIGGMTGGKYAPNMTHACHFCDSCIPDLQFDTSRAVAPDHSEQFDDLRAKAIDAFADEDTTTVLNISQEARERRCLAPLGYPATSHLESYPDNLAANLLAAEAHRVSPNEADRGRAHRYDRQYARVANVERKDVEQARIGYSAYHRYDATEVIRVYSPSGGALDNPDDLIRMADDASRSELERGENDNLQLAAMEAVKRRLADSAREIGKLLP